MIDLSDGLATDAAHLGRASGAELRVELARLPAAEGLGEVAAALRVDPAELAAAGGEDYELCFTSPRSGPRRRSGPRPALEPGSRGSGRSPPVRRG